MNKIKELIYIIVKKTLFLKETGKEKKYPEILQLPITYKCNSKCRVCNIWKISKEEISLKDFENIIKDDVFKKIKAVGVNGGEPFILNNLEEYIKIIINNLPNLKSLNIITNGFLSDRILEKTEKIYEICKENGIKFDISVSLDGVASIHDQSRGLNDVFNKTFETIKKIKDNIHKYADNFSVACTISKINEDYLPELESFAKNNNIKIKYRMAVDIKRLKNESIYKELNAFSDFSSREFIFRCFKKTPDLLDKFRYYSIFTSIISDRKKRLLGCNWKNKGITLDPYGNIYYCAVRSKSIGNLVKKSGEDVFLDYKNLDYRAGIVRSCTTCAHDYEGKIYYKNLTYFFVNFVFDVYWVNLYQIKKYLL
jgi:MoaA/NifB/PqqE/SkfB family radical SAM enzyme